MLWHSCTKRLVPNMLMVTDSLRASSNLTVAAEWKTTDVLLNRISWFARDIPNSSSVMSPSIGINFASALGLFWRTVSNNCKQNKIVILVYMIKQSFKFNILKVLYILLPEHSIGPRASAARPVPSWASWASRCSWCPDKTWATSPRVLCPWNRCHRWWRRICPCSSPWHSDIPRQPCY